MQMEYQSYPNCNISLPVKLIQQLQQQHFHFISKCFSKDSLINSKLSQDDTDYDEDRRCHCKVHPIHGKCCYDNKCINRLSLYECITCDNTKYCQNQNFLKHKYKELNVLETPNKGFGLFAKEKISKDEFIIEYVGEYFPFNELKSRIKNQYHLYILQIQNNTFLDATRYGSISRFINHSCEPNCRMEIWVVDNELRAGIFAIKLIEENEELTFDYKWQPSSKRKPTTCHCGTPSCRGTLELLPTKVLVESIELSEMKEYIKKGKWRISSEAIEIMNQKNYEWLINRRVKILWDGNQEYFEAQVEGFNEVKNVYYCRYLTDNTINEEYLIDGNVSWEWLDEEAEESSIKKRKMSLGDQLDDEDDDDLFFPLIDMRATSKTINKPKKDIEVKTKVEKKTNKQSLVANILDIKVYVSLHQEMTLSSDEVIVKRFLQFIQSTHSIDISYSNDIIEIEGKDELMKGFIDKFVTLQQSIRLYREVQDNELPRLQNDYRIISFDLIESLAELPKFERIGISLKRILSYNPPLPDYLPVGVVQRLQENFGMNQEKYHQLEKIIDTLATLCLSKFDNLLKITSIDLSCTFIRCAILTLRYYSNSMNISMKQDDIFQTLSAICLLVVKSQSKIQSIHKLVKKLVLLVYCELYQCEVDAISDQVLGLLMSKVIQQEEHVVNYFEYDIHILLSSNKQVLTFIQVICKDLPILLMCFPLVTLIDSLESFVGLKPSSPWIHDIVHELLPKTFNIQVNRSFPSMNSMKSIPSSLKHHRLFYHRFFQLTYLASNSKSLISLGTSRELVCSKVKAFELKKKKQYMNYYHSNEDVLGLSWNALYELQLWHQLNWSLVKVNSLEIQLSTTLWIPLTLFMKHLDKPMVRRFMKWCCQDLLRNFEMLINKDIHLLWLSPSNLFINSQGHIKLNDLSSASLHDEISITQEGVNPLLDFCPPEVILGANTSEASTIWIFSLLCHHMLCNKGITKASNDKNKQLQYLFKVLGTPKKMEYPKEDYDVLPLSQTLDKQVLLDDGSFCESKSRLDKILPNNLNIFNEEEQIEICEWMKPCLHLLPSKRLKLQDLKKLAFFEKPILLSTSYIDEMLQLVNTTTTTNSSH